MQPLISVIVPIYKVEQYLSECVDSILQQSYENLEVILVDDGSPDSCPEICDRYAVTDNRIKVIHKPNGGLSDARNTGLKAATGEYILFIDSDDYWIDKNAIKKLIEKLVNSRTRSFQCDLVFFGRTTFSSNKIFEQSADYANKININDKTHSLEVLLRDADFIPSACQKLIRRSLLIENSLFFKSGLLSEDYDWSLQLYSLIKSFTAVNENFYGYRKREGSITQSFSPKHADDILYILEKWTKRLETDSLLNEVAESYYGFLAYIYCCSLVSIALMPNKMQGEYRSKYKKYRGLLKYDLNPKVAKVKKLYSLLGYNLTVRALGYYINHRSKNN